MFSVLLTHQIMTEKTYRELFSWLFLLFTIYWQLLYTFHLNKLQESSSLMTNF